MINNINFKELVRLSFAELGYANPSQIDMNTPLWIDGFDEKTVSNLFLQIEEHGNFDFSGDFYQEFCETVTPDFSLAIIANTLKKIFDKYPEKDINQKPTRKTTFRKKVNATTEFNKVMKKKKQMVANSQNSLEK